MNQEQIFLTLFILAGAALGGLGLSLIVNTRRFLRTAVRTQGRVVGYEEREGRGDGPGTITYQYPQVEYEGPAGEIQRVTLALGRDRRPYPEGTLVPILFNPACPANATIESFSEMWQIPIVMFVLGLATIGGALAVWLSHRA